MDQPRDTVPQRYMFKQCSTPHCTVMIGWAIGSLQGISICKWCQQGKAYYADGNLQGNSKATGDTHNSA